MKEHCIAQRKGSSTEGRRLEKRKRDGEFGKQLISIQEGYKIVYCGKREHNDSIQLTETNRICPN